MYVWYLKIYIDISMFAKEVLRKITSTWYKSEYLSGPAGRVLNYTDTDKNRLFVVCLRNCAT